jgi:lysozyme family protein
MAFEDGPLPYRYKTGTDNNGGLVISGINSKSFPSQLAAISAIPQVQRGPAVQNFYAQQFWNQWYAQLTSDESAKRIFDAAVNMGKGTGVRIAQLAAGCQVDGAWGPNTVAAINSMADFVPAFQEARLAHYRTIVAGNPSYAVYLGTADKPGPWWRRAVA